jgi:psiF repeat
MKATLIALILCALAGNTVAQTPAPTCKAQATDKKLSGAALTSFMKKCETDAGAACDSAATEKKLAGAAKASFTKKCVTDAVGN